MIFIGWRGQSSAFCDENRVFYLLLKEKGVFEIGRTDRLLFIGEYGNLENHGSLSKYLSEHGSCICKSGAVEKLGIL